MNVLIIIPTYNEKANITLLLQQIIKTSLDVSIVVVDDNSPDGTSRTVEEFAKTSSYSIDLINRTGKRGLGTVYKAGFLYGLAHDYDVFVTMDADLSHNPIYLSAMLDAIQHSDVVIGSRYIRDGGTVHWKIWRILLSWCANQCAHLGAEWSRSYIGLSCISAYNTGSGEFGNNSI